MTVSYSTAAATLHSASNATSIITQLSTAAIYPGVDSAAQPAIALRTVARKTTVQPFTASLATSKAMFPGPGNAP